MKIVILWCGLEPQLGVINVCIVTNREKSQKIFFQKTIGQNNRYLCKRILREGRFKFVQFMIQGARSCDTILKGAIFKHWEKR